jgi:hypothetical protein
MPPVRLRGRRVLGLCPLCPSFHTLVEFWIFHMIPSLTLQNWSPKILQGNDSWSVTPPHPPNKRKKETWKLKPTVIQRRVVSLKYTGISEVCTFSIIRFIHHPDDGGSTHLLNVGLRRDYTALYPRRLPYSTHRRENLRSQKKPYVFCRTIHSYTAWQTTGLRLQPQ